MKKKYSKPQVMSLEQTEAVRLAAASISGIRSLKSFRSHIKMTEKKNDETNY